MSSLRQQKQLSGSCCTALIMVRIISTQNLLVYGELIAIYTVLSLLDLVLESNDLLSGLIDWSFRDVDHLYDNAP